MRLVAVLSSSVALAACAPAIVWHGHDPTRRVRVEVLERSRRQFVRIQGRDGPRYDAVGFEALAISAGGRHAAYPVLHRGRWRLVHDGRPGSSWDAIGDVALSRDGRSVAYAAQGRGRWRVVTNGAAGPAIDAMLRGSLAWAPDGRLVYAARVGGAIRVFVGSTAQAPWDAVGAIRLGPGHRVVYVARRGDAATVVVDGRPGSTWDDVRELVVAPATGRVAYLGRRAGRDFVVIDAVEHGPFEELAMLRASDDGHRVVWVERSGGRHRVVRDGVPLAEVEQIEELVLSGDGGHTGWLARDGANRKLVIDGRPLRRDPNLSSLVLAPRGGRYAYVQELPRSTLVITDAGAERFDLVVRDTLQFSRDGRHWACLAGRSRALFVVVDGCTRRPFDFDELAAALQQAARGVREVPTDLLRRWVAAELERVGNGRVHRSRPRRSSGGRGRSALRGMRTRPLL